MYKILFFLLFYSTSVLAQTTFPINKVKNTFEPTFAFINAHIIINPTNNIENGTLLIRGKKIIDVGANISVPENAIIYDLQGDFIYPSFIYLNTHFGIEKNQRKEWSPNPQYESNKQGAFSWNQAIHPEINANEIFSYNEKEAKEFRQIGFGVVLTHQQDGIIRGSGLLTSLSNLKANESIINGYASGHLSFNKGTSRQKYPNSQMGSIALIKQTYLDAEWYNQTQQEEYNISLESFVELEKLPQFFEVDDKLSALRASSLAQLFNREYIIIGNGDEYQRLDDIKSTNFPLVIPLNFPKAYDVSDMYSAKMVSLKDLKHWELAPLNPKLLAKNNILFSFTTTGLKKKNEFLSNLKKSVKHGLSYSDALAALTTNPAKIIMASDKIGTLEKGKFANFLICSDNIFEKGIIYSNWIQGKEFVINEKNLIDSRGNYLLLGDTLKITGKLSKPEAILIIDSVKIKVKVKQDRQHFTFEFKKKGVVRISAILNNDSLKGTIIKPNGISDLITIHKISDTKPNKKNPNKKITVKEEIWYPNMAFGFNSIPTHENIIFSNATVWTNEDEGIILNTDVAIGNGKIISIGNKLNGNQIFKNKSFKEIDATDLHLTCGIIDEHSHIAISKGVNEGSQASSAEVSILDVINSDDINIYRQLASGVTTAQLLHGSANPIGGQSAIIKFRWGSSPEKMKFENAPLFIKFALGENVKQSNWGDFETIRFPQTRMGVEQVFYDYFLRAENYKQEWNTYNNLSSKNKRKTLTPRVDLELQTLAEILDGNRHITCHSYIQSEINMLMHVADSMGFKINTFTHILEGYKLADKMREHNAGGSTFSDWWAYKFEVNDAIPYNASLLNQMGVLTAINSDDAEMARRLNQEAAKAVKYGGTSEEDAWKMVTLNPAKLLHIDKRVGSIKIGKDADIVLWSENPLSVYAKVLQTYIDGKCYFNVEKNEELNTRNNKERNRIIQKMLNTSSEDKQTPRIKPNKLYHCDTLEDE